MKYFENFTSNTVAGSGNQFFFINDDPTEIHKGRIFFKIFKGGRYNYSILFSNIIDSTFNDGAISHKNIVCDEWYIKNMKIGSCSECSADRMTEVNNFTDLTFGGNLSKTVMPGEMFSSDPVSLDLADEQYICLEISFSGKMIPDHQETLVPSFLYENDNWIPSPLMPFPSMIGCDRKVKKRIAFFGDSITQGIGTEVNSYSHWNACTSHLLGCDNSYWNLGLGFGRADDAASDGVWLFKAKQADVVIMCFGVNDILHGYTAEQIIHNLRYTVTKLKERNIKVVVQTVPPFDYDEAHKATWLMVNEYIKNELSQYCELIFDTVPVLCDKTKGIEFSAYGGHPNAHGCLLWGKALYEALKDTDLV